MSKNNAQEFRELVTEHFERIYDRLHDLETRLDEAEAENIQRYLGKILLADHLRGNFTQAVNDMSVMECRGLLDWMRSNRSYFDEILEHWQLSKTEPWYGTVMTSLEKRIARSYDNLTFLESRRKRK